MKININPTWLQERIQSDETDAEYSKSDNQIELILNIHNLLKEWNIDKTKAIEILSEKW